MEKKKRFYEIDVLRGGAIAIMILTHTNYFYLSNPRIHFTWNWLFFAVTMFVFSSAYIFFMAKKEIKLAEGVDFIYKRVKRLLIPYYLFLIPYFFIASIYEPNKLTSTYITNNILVWGGLETNWVVMLFLQLSVIMPLILLLYQRHRLLFYLYAFASIVSSIIFLFYRPDFNYRWIMWLPWSIVILFAFYMARSSRSFHHFVKTKLVLWVIFALTFGIVLFEQGSTIFFDHKYPPSLYYLSYGMAMVTLVFILAEKNFFDWSPLKRLLTFLSTYSYELFFVHYILINIRVVIFKEVQLSWISFFIIIFIGSLLTMIMLNKIRSLLFVLKSSQ